MRIGRGFDMPECEIKGCELSSQFHGFGHDFCWQHYSAWLVNWNQPKNKLSTGNQLQLELFGG